MERQADALSRAERHRLRDTAGLILALPIVGVAGFVTVVFVAFRLVSDEQTVDRLRSLIDIETANPEPPS